MKKIIGAVFLPLAVLSFLPLSSLALDSPSSGTSYAYPLPAPQGSILNLVYTMAEPGSVQVWVFNESGDQVMNFTDLKPLGVQSSQVDLCCLAPGVYIYMVMLDYDSGNKEKLKPAKFVVVH